jgi:enhancing lycopene biosynthesis protein 2
MHKVGIVLSGCGVFDGSEIHEAVCTMLALEQAGVEYQCMAPNSPQLHVIDHTKGKPVPGESRNILTESARIARGKIVELGDVRVSEYDALIFPGGFGAAKNLCSFAVHGSDCTVQPDVARVIREAHAAGKPLCFICIAPVIAAKVLGAATGVKLTIGDEKETSAAINRMGASHINCPVRGAVVDEQQKVVSTPAYMKAGNIAEVYDGVKSAVTETLRLIS